MKKNSLAILICFIFLGILVSAQFKIVNQLTKGKISATEATKLELELQNLQGERKDLLNQLNSLDHVIAQYENYESEKDIFIKEIKNDMDQYKLINGQTNVKGPGIIIKFKNSELYRDIDMSSYYPEYLLAIINILNASDAEAICINDERIISTTGITFLADKNKLMINEKEMIPPFEIKSIGNPDKLESILNIKYGLIWNIHKENIFELEIEKRNDIEIRRCSKKIELKYTKPSEKTVTEKVYQRN
ncbi:DUF881 domain-containing protein [Crassaminicella profunda]|uniref:DUF881 domain-containing protein n=1 Tax=Crassaminicella profunda TaxID=1286698 RepID=UPI001CA7B135|nr:DUF881 domain-containing protein [Crassaminicella profunda]QZY55031.1 DUF881 domain-containing protein [Crassaminicella profunda]